MYDSFHFGIHPGEMMFVSFTPFESLFILWLLIMVVVLLLLSYSVLAHILCCVSMLIMK